MKLELFWGTKMEIIIKYIFLAAILLLLTILTKVICHVNLIMCRESAYEYCLLNVNPRTRKRSQRGLLEYKKILDFLTKMLT